MMKKILKGFTLMELIIVMAILTILMAAIMRMFKPIRETYVDSTLYENQRTVQNGIIQYVNESLRYATDVGIYNTPDKSSMQQAVEEFADAYCHKNSSANKSTVMNEAEVIIIDNEKTYTFNGKKCTGRLLRRNNVGDASWNESTNTRLALGAAYYGENSYAIKITQPIETTDAVAALDWRADEGIKMTVASTASYGQRQLQKSEGFGFKNKLINTEG
ncbi:MAG: type II secretion system GspH family protein, partial [Oscillospiraceae bacterium]|nr:type II secretion system GspH family protein [Oscillospiraceae bacterium]